MRTRSQPASPGGFAFLEKEPRRARSARRAASRQPSAEPTTTTRSRRSASTRPSSIEPVSQPTTRITKPASRQTSAVPTTRRTRSAANRPASAGPSMRVTRSQTRSAANSRVTSSDRVTKPRNRRRAASAVTRRPNRRPTRKASVDETAPVEVEEGSADDNPPKDGTEGSEAIPSMVDTALSEPTSSDINRKRRRESREDEAETPLSNKRRNLGPRADPFRRRLRSLSQLVPIPHSERKRRRVVEGKGRIYKTVFRLPTLLAQNESDRQAAASAPPSPSAEPPQPANPVSEEPAQPEGERPGDEAATPQAPSTPEAAPSGWNIRGLINSVPRTISRLLPRFGQPTRAGEAQGTPQLPSDLRSELPSDLPSEMPSELPSEMPSELHSEMPSDLPSELPLEMPSDLPSELPSPTLTPALLEPSLSPFPEPITGTEDVDSEVGATTTARRVTRRVGLQAPRKRQHTIDYSLFPRPIDRDTFLGGILKDLKKPAPAVQQESRPDEGISEPQEQPEVVADIEEQRDSRHSAAETTKKKRKRSPSPAAQPETHADGGISEPQEQPEVVADVEEQRGSRHSAAKKTKKKRKRSPSPDVIPNPPGCSYGMDLDYFGYSSESSESEEEADAQPQELKPSMKPGPFVKPAVRRAIQSERGPSKRVRFDASPQDTPSKLRARQSVTSPFQENNIIGMGDSPDSPSTAPATPDPVPFVDPYTPTRRPGFIPNTQGTFQLDYDAFSDDSDSSGEPSPPSSPVRERVVETVQESMQLPAPRQILRQAEPPSTPVRVDPEALARVRSQAEKYKPKTPSGLRTASRYSSPLTASPDVVTPRKPVERFDDVITPEEPVEHFDDVVTPEELVEHFGEDDEFARDAQWLYENCPTGNLEELQWPTKSDLEDDLEDDLGADTLKVEIMADVWDSLDYGDTRHDFLESMGLFEESMNSFEESMDSFEESMDSFDYGATRHDFLKSMDSFAETLA